MFRLCLFRFHPLLLLFPWSLFGWSSALGSSFRFAVGRESGGGICEDISGTYIFSYSMSLCVCCVYLAARFGVGVDRVPALPLVSGEATISGAASPATRDDLRGPVDGAGRTF